MKRLNKMTLENLLTIKSEPLRTLLDETAHETGKDCWLYKPVNTQSKVCIVAHIDTVFDDDFSRYQTWSSGKQWNSTTKQWEEKEIVSKPRRVFHDEKKGVFWSPDGLGADDRAGMFAGLHLFNTIPEEHRPFLLLTDYEEVGGVGAKEVYRAFQSDLQDVTMFIELDRQGADDIVTYQDEGKDFIEYLEGFGFSEAFGSYSDISTFCPEFMICGANLSIGYYRQHTKEEYLIESELWATVEKVKKICADNSKVWVMPEKVSYLPVSSYEQNRRGIPSFECPECGTFLTLSEVCDGLCPFCYTEIDIQDGKAVAVEENAPLEVDYINCSYCSTTIFPEDFRNDDEGWPICLQCHEALTGQAAGIKVV